MKTKMMCVVVLGFTAVLSAGRMVGQSPSADQDKIFLMKAAESDMAEIKLSQLALDKSSDPMVKEYAQKMITDHNMLEANMKPFADKYGVTPPSSLSDNHQAQYDKLSALSGKDFDKAYIHAMDKDHHMAETDFKSEIASTKDNELKMTVKSGEKVVAEHTKMADHMAAKMHVGMGARADDGSSRQQ